MSVPASLNVESVRLPNVPAETNQTINRLLDRLNRKASRNALRLAYYDGKRAVTQIGTLIPPQYMQLGIVLGWSAKGVDTLSRRCHLDSFVWPDGDLEALGAKQVWDDNFLASEIDSAITASLIHGPSFLINTRGDSDENEPESLIHVKDALSATGDWNARARRLENLLSLTSRDENGRLTGLVFYENNQTTEAVRSTRSNAWTVTVTPHPWGVPAELLSYKPRPGRPFGSSRISRPVMSLHDQALRAVVRLDAHMDVYSFPEYWMLGADESIFKNADGTPKTSFQVMLGRIKGIPDDDDAAVPRADVKQFAASNPTPHLADLNALAKLFCREMSLPDSSLAITDFANPTSADSYDASQYELIAEAEGAVDDWTPGLRRSFMRALAIKNNLSEIPADWSSIDTKWRDPRYVSRAAQADAGSKQLAAVPWLAETEVGLELLGLSERQIDRALADRRRNAGSGVLEALQAAAAQVTGGNEPSA